MPTILIVVPCYNEANRIDLKAFESILLRSKSMHFLFVNDGSADQTAQLLIGFCSKQSNASFLNLATNLGKAEAIRAGVKSVLDKDWDYIGYFDADLATPLKELDRFSDLIDKKDWPYLIMGSRIKILGMTTIKRKLSRHYIGRIFATIVSNMLQLPIYDTQCGAKLIRKDLCSSLFAEAFTSKWLFDVELIFRLKKLKDDYAKKIIEVPLNHWEDKSGSKISKLYFVKAPIDLIKIYLRYR